jgi:hypothetical protein
LKTGVTWYSKLAIRGVPELFFGFGLLGAKLVLIAQAIHENSQSAIFFLPHLANFGYSNVLMLAV